MAVPVLNLNLAPRPSLWRQRHQFLGWLALVVGATFFVGSLALTWRAYHQAGRAGREAVNLTEEARRAARQEQQLQASLQDMDASVEQSRWKVAERILLERSLPWSRVTAELEQCMVPDLRLKGLQRTRSSGQQVVMKLKAEARTQQAETAFVEALRAAPVFAQVILDRESERPGGGWELELSLFAATVPPPFKVKPAQRATHAPTATPSAPLRPAATVTMPRPPTAIPTAAPPPTAGRPSAPPLQGRPDGVQTRPLPTEDEEARPRRRPIGRDSRRPS